MLLILGRLGECYMGTMYYFCNFSISPELFQNENIFNNCIYFILFYFNFLINLFLFSYNCLHFLPFPPPHPSQSHLPPPPLPSPLILSLCGERGRKGGKHQCVVASCEAPTGDLACNPGLCPDWELNWWPFGSQARTQSTEPHQLGLKIKMF